MIDIDQLFAKLKEIEDLLRKSAMATNPYAIDTKQIMIILELARRIIADEVFGDDRKKEIDNPSPGDGKRYDDD